MQTCFIHDPNEDGFRFHKSCSRAHVSDFYLGQSTFFQGCAHFSCDDLAKQTNSFIFRPPGTVGLGKTSPQFSEATKEELSGRACQLDTLKTLVNQPKLSTCLHAVFGMSPNPQVQWVKIEDRTTSSYIIKVRNKLRTIPIETCLVTSQEGNGCRIFLR